MSYEIIDHQKWREFLDSFARAHEGWLVSIKALDTSRISEDTQGNENFASDILPKQFPLEDIRESESEEGTGIMVTVGSGGDEDSILIENVSRVYLHKLDSADKGLRIDSGNNITMLVEFHAPASPETLDGILIAEL